MSSNNNKFIVAAILAFAAWGISKLISAENNKKMMKKPGADGYKERSKFERQMSGVPLDESHGGPHTAKPKKFGGNINVNENCITTQRERMKETGEYKKTLEEELVSRQKALVIQAQEAKKLKLMLRRKKAESKRLLEMEKRQKQRVEEMRKTQKKDVENMNLKEHLRVEVGKELSQLEMTCHDMASVLCRLGIAVGHGTTHERQMSGVSLGESHGGPNTATKTLSKCNDGDGADVPDSTPKKFRGNINVNENCITTQRERMKETCEYKKALEEEVTSRQKALAIQVQITKQSQKFCPEAIVFLQTLVMAASDKEQRSENLQLNNLMEIKELEPLLCIRSSNVEIDSLDFLELMDLPEDSQYFHSDNYRASMLVTVLETLQGFVNVYKELISFPEIFMPISKLLCKLAGEGINSL